MINIKNTVIICCVSLIGFYAGAQDTSRAYHEHYRPQVHFSPKAHWVNDPNGMVYYNGIYHLFYQYFPGGTTWGPMHWGHAESKDLMHWQELPVALYPDSLGYIFSGSAVADLKNTSGFGKNGKTPLVAIFTHHDPKGEKAGRDNYQNQSLAYSLNNGKTWAKYTGNPVLKNPGIKDFRDPKVRWFEAGKKWIMTLATKDRITFFSSPNLKQWKKESEFGLKVGAHGGVWECPDLFPLKFNNKTYWVLVVNLNPGGPNGGSATQYFVGQFNGSKFIPVNTKTKWLDYGPDEYAGVTWSNTPDRTIFLGWMSNWEYANRVPTVSWRNAMTIPRELSLKKVNQELLVASVPVKELSLIAVKTKVLTQHQVKQKVNLSKEIVPGQYLFKMSTLLLKGYEITLSNKAGEELLLGFDQDTRQYFIDRTKSGRVDFEKNFKGRFFAPRLASGSESDLTLLIDDSSVELFADHGLTVMTAVYFPGSAFNTISISSKAGLQLKNLQLQKLSSIWK